MRKVALCMTAVVDLQWSDAPPAQTQLFLNQGRSRLFQLLTSSSALDCLAFPINKHYTIIRSSTFYSNFGRSLTLFCDAWQNVSLRQHPKFILKWHCNNESPCCNHKRSFRFFFHLLCCHGLVRLELWAAARKSTRARVWHYLAEQISRLRLENSRPDSTSNGSKKTTRNMWTRFSKNSISEIKYTNLYKEMRAQWNNAVQAKQITKDKGVTIPDAGVAAHQCPSLQGGPATYNPLCTG